MALMRAALGVAMPPLVVRNCRTTAAHPATSGVAMLVPPSKKYSGSALASHPVFVVTRERVERMAVPGATTSGLLRPFCTGPRLLNAAMPSGLFATWSEAIGFAGNELGHPCPYVRPLSKIGRSFSV